MACCDQFWMSFIVQIALILMPMATSTKTEGKEAVIRYSYEFPAAIDRDNHPGPNGTPR
jgi:hypothetical protein